MKKIDPVASRPEAFELVFQGVHYTVPVYCPHRGGRLDLGHHNLEKGVVVCPMHGAVFCLRSGRLLAGPEESDFEAKGPLTIRRREE